jgi:hypothetical protein
VDPVTYYKEHNEEAAINFKIEEDPNLIERLIVAETFIGFSKLL